MPITILLIVINIIIYLYMEITGDTESALFMMEHGAIYPPKLLEDGEYWRLFSSMFLHFGMSHLINNMVVLGSAGQILERAIGKWKYLVLYLIAGLGGSLLSFLQMVHSGEYSVAAGASGAIFGIIGALGWIVIVHKGRYESLTGKGLVAMILLCLYYGFTAGNVDNWGHIGGLLMGFLMSIILYRTSADKGLRKDASGGYPYGQEMPLCNGYTYSGYTYDKKIICLADVCEREETTYEGL